jgi:hypothetical protein
MRKYRVSRFKQFIFPQELIIDKYHVLTRKRHFPSFWLVTEESIPLSKLASIQIHRGFLFSKLIIENSGGPYPIVVEGLWNRAAREARDILERIEREMQAGYEIAGQADDEAGEDGTPPGGRGPEPAQPVRPPHKPRDERRPEETRTSPSQTAFDIAMNRITDSISKVSRAEASEREGAETPPSGAYDHFPLLKPKAGSSNPDPPPPETRRSAPSRTDRLIVPLPERFGELPSDQWRPRAPWDPAPADKAEGEDEPGLRTIDPVEFLSQDALTQTALKERAGVRRDYLGELANWWDRAKSTLMASGSKQTRRKRRLQ